MNKVGIHLKKCEEYAKKNKLPILAVTVDYMYSRMRFGFSSEDYFHNTPGYYVRNCWKSDFFSFKRWQKVLKNFNNQNYCYLLENKVESLKFFKDFVQHKWIYPRECSFTEFNEFIRNTQGAIIIKPIDGICGNGIKSFSSSNDSHKDYEELCKKAVLLEEYIKQDQRLVFKNNSVNTLRVYTILDKNNNVHILKAILRAGIGDTVTDNYHTGGVIYPISIEEGLVESYGVRRDDNTKICVHPGTDIIMLGYKIPKWKETLSMVKAMHCKVPEIRYIGWDIAISDNGPDFIEANHNADHALFGVIGLERLFYKQILKYK